MRLEERDKREARGKAGRKGGKKDVRGCERTRRTESTVGGKIACARKKEKAAKGWEEPTRA